MGLHRPGRDLKGEVVAIAVKDDPRKAVRLRVDEAERRLSGTQMLPHRERRLQTLGEIVLKALYPSFEKAHRDQGVRVVEPGPK